MAKTDIVMLCFLTFSFLTGWHNGLFRTILGPLSILLCAIAAIIYYDVSHNLIMSLLIASVGSIALALIFKIFFMFARSTVDKNYRNTTFIGSRLLGGLLNMSWKAALLSVVLILTTLLPGQLFQLRRIQDDVKQSVSYQLIQKYAFRKAPQSQNIIETLKVLQDPERLRRMSDTPEYQEFYSDEQLQSLITDEQIAEQIRNKDISGLMSNPKILDLMQNEELLEKFGRLSKKIYDTEAENEATNPAVTP
jgi:hypothetical protein